MGWIDQTLDGRVSKMLNLKGPALQKPQPGEILLRGTFSLNAVKKCQNSNF